MEEKEWMRFSEAAIALGLSEGKLRFWARQGRIETRRDSGVYEVRLLSVRQAMAHPAPLGRPPGANYEQLARLLARIAATEERLALLKAQLAGAQ